MTDIAWSIGLPVCITSMSRAKTAESIEMAFQILIKEPYSRWEPGYWTEKRCGLLLLLASVAVYMYTA